MRNERSAHGVRSGYAKKPATNRHPTKPVQLCIVESRHEDGQNSSFITSSAATASLGADTDDTRMLRALKLR